ncbi:hypothetical protein HDZ31DRAFT_39268 [Schizophyllum fasciatum]
MNYTTASSCAASEDEFDEIPGLSYSNDTETPYSPSLSRSSSATIVEPPAEYKGDKDKIDSQPVSDDVPPVKTIISSQPISADDILLGIRTHICTLEHLEARECLDTAATCSQPYSWIVASHLGSPRIQSLMLTTLILHDISNVMLETLVECVDLPYLRTLFLSRKVRPGEKREAVELRQLLEPTQDTLRTLTLDGVEFVGGTMKAICACGTLERMALKLPCKYMSGLLHALQRSQLPYLSHLKAVLQSSDVLDIPAFLDVLFYRPQLRTVHLSVWQISDDLDLDVVTQLNTLRNSGRLLLVERCKAGKGAPMGA